MTKNRLTFIIPILHPENCRDWRTLKQHLLQTANSIAAQDCRNWKAVVVANKGSDLPPLPVNFDIKYVEFPPNAQFGRGKNDLETFREAVRLDKGRRLLAGMIHAGEMGHVMFVDHDDFISRHLTSFVSNFPESYGWYVKDGYLWGSGGKLVYKFNEFSHVCGTSHIVRSDLYEMPSGIEDADPKYIRKILGSHIFIEEHLASKGTPIIPLPFSGAVYRVGHENSHSKSSQLFRIAFLKPQLIFNPREVVKRISRFNLVDSSFGQEFFGWNPKQNDTLTKDGKIQS